MKVLFLLLISLGTALHGKGQTLKDLGRKIKGDAEWRIRQKADQQLGKGIDSLLGAKKKKDNQQSKPGATTQKPPQKSPKNNGAAESKNEAGPTQGASTHDDNIVRKDGFITLNLSSNTLFTGGSVRISGESINYKNYNQVEIKVDGPTSDVRNVTLTSTGSYAIDWVASEKTGDYTVTVTGSDKKAVQTAHFTVSEIDIVFAEDWPEENTAETKKALDQLEDAVEKVATYITSKDKAELQKKMEHVKAKVTSVLTLFKDLNTAGKELSRLARSGKRPSQNMSLNLSYLNENLAGQAEQMKKVADMADHQPQDNTICEYLVMLNEACAAFSTFTNVWSKSIGTILQNIVIDKGVPKQVEVMSNGRLPGGVEFSGKESAKIFATSLFDAESLQTTLGRAGVAGDLTQYTSEVLMKAYCGVFKGSFTHDYTIEFRNKKGQNWWKYGVEMKATIALRYPKEKAAGDVISMKGNLEGNATKFTFFQDLEKQEDLNRGSIANFKIIPIKTFTPLAVSVATSERDIMGFGAIARGLATPAYFNIAVDAEYNVKDGKIKLLINDALMDFTDLVANQFVFFMVGADGIPYIRKMDFPIHKAKITIGGVVSARPEFEVQRDSKGNQSFTGKGNKHIGNRTTVRETDLNFSITAKQE